MTSSQLELKIFPLTPERWNDFEKLFGDKTAELNLTDEELGQYDDKLEERIKKYRSVSASGQRKKQRKYRDKEQ